MTSATEWFCTGGHCAWPEGHNAANALYGNSAITELINKKVKVPV